MKKKLSLKPIPPTLRGKKRYIAFRLECENPLREKEVFEAVWKTFFELFGSVGTARQKLWPIMFSEKQGIAVIRCSLECLHEAKAGILFIKEVHGKPASPRILLVSGSMKRIKKRLGLGVGSRKPLAVRKK